MNLSLEEAILECQRLGIKPVAGGTGAEAIAIVAVVAAVAAAGVGTYTAVKSANDAAAQANYQKKAVEAESKQREYDAQAALEEAAFEEKQHRRRVALLRAETASVYAAAGYVPSSGTPLIQDIDIAQQGELEALSIKRAGQISSNVAQFQSEASQFQSGLLSNRRKQLLSSRGPTIAAGTLSALSSGAQAYSNYTYSNKTTRKAVTSDWTGPR